MQKGKDGHFHWLFLRWILVYKIPGNGELVAVHGEYSAIEENNSFVLLADNMP